MDALRKFLLEADPLGRATQPTSTLTVTLRDLETLVEAVEEGYYCTLDHCDDDCSCEPRCECCW
ncbi:MAG: hypothetical protein ACTHJ9_14005 [Rhodanobacter sp.]